MQSLTKLTLVYVLNNTPFFFTQHKIYNNKTLTILLDQYYFYFLALHLKLATSFYATQLIEIFTYDVPTTTQPTMNSASHLPTSNTIVNYNFHNLFSQERLFIFTATAINLQLSVDSKFNLKSISELFANANWLEREASEMSGLMFEGKKDLRNLMLPYGDSSSPIRKSFPSTGFKEIFYDSNNDTLIQTPLTLQI